MSGAFLRLEWSARGVLRWPFFVPGMNACGRSKRRQSGTYQLMAVSC